MVKMDVNGAELEVLRCNFLHLLERRRVEHLVVEWNPHLWARYAAAANSSSQAGADFIQLVVSYGYDVSTMLGAVDTSSTTSLLQFHEMLVKLAIYHSTALDLYFELKSATPDP